MAGSPPGGGRDRVRVARPRRLHGRARRNRRLAFILIAVFALIALAILASPFATAPTRP